MGHISIRDVQPIRADRLFSLVSFTAEKKLQIKTAQANSSCRCTVTASVLIAIRHATLLIQPELNYDTVHDIPLGFWLNVNDDVTHSISLHSPFHNEAGSNGMEDEKYASSNACDCFEFPSHALKRGHSTLFRPEQYPRLDGEFSAGFKLANRTSVFLARLVFLRYVPSYKS